MSKSRNKLEDYGTHKYADYDGTSDCEHGCGCWMGPARSGGPTGINPSGTCPFSPKDGGPAGKADIDNVIGLRISELSRRAYEAENKLKQVSPSKIKLAEELETARQEVRRLNTAISHIQASVNNALT